MNFVFDKDNDRPISFINTDPKRKKKTICKSDDKHKEQQKDKHEDVRKGLQKS